MVMARTYRLSAWRRVANLLVRALLRIGIGPRHTYLLTARGRKSDRTHSTPVTLVEEDGLRWLVAPYGEVAWVRNVRAAGEDLRIASPGGHARAQALHQRGPDHPPYFDLTRVFDSTVFAAEASRHPVFRIAPTTEGGR